MTITRREATAIPAYRPTSTSTSSGGSVVVPGIEGEGVVVMGTIMGGGVVMIGSSTVENNNNLYVVRTMKLR